MKKSNVFGMLLIGLLITSCSKDEAVHFPEIPEENQQEIPEEAPEETPEEPPVEETPEEPPVEEPPVEEPPVEEPLASKFQMDGIDHPTPFGYLSIYSGRSNIFLMEKDFDGDIFNDFYCSFPNDLSHTIYLTILADLPQLEDGSYSYAIEGNEGSEVRVEVATNYSFEDGCLQDYESILATSNIKEGILTVEKSGDTYVLNYSISYFFFTTVKELTGHFEGNLKDMPLPL